jgi:F0F1-type ATP synthase assembly protein I
MDKPESGRSRPRKAPLGHDRRDAERAESRQWYQMAGLGVEFIVAILILGGLGYWLDGRWGTRPWLMVIGGAAGFALGMWHMVRAAMKAFHD